MEKTETEVLVPLETEQHHKPPIEDVTGESDHVCSMVYSGTLRRFPVQILVWITLRSIIFGPPKGRSYEFSAVSQSVSQ